MSGVRLLPRVCGRCLGFCIEQVGDLFYTARGGRKRVELLAITFHSSRATRVI
jgi:hypothetical protein